MKNWQCPLLEFPKHRFSWKVLAAALKQNGKINESLVASQKSVQLDPQDAEAITIWVS